MTVEQMLQMPFYHPVVEEGLRTALRDLDTHVKRAREASLAGEEARAARCNRMGPFPGEGPSMISLGQLWLPILVTAIAVFAASSLVHMVFAGTFPTTAGSRTRTTCARWCARARPVPGSTSSRIAPIPRRWAAEMVARFKEGPIGVLVLRPVGMPSMGKPLGLWFGLNLLVAILAGYLACRTLAAGSSFPQIFRVVGLFTFAAYAIGPLQQAVWMGKPWASACKEAGDALIYGVVTGLVFGWLWPS
jgi:hypothetical protein